MSSVAGRIVVLLDGVGLCVVVDEDEDDAVGCGVVDYCVVDVLCVGSSAGAVCSSSVVVPMSSSTVS